MLSSDSQGSIVSNSLIKIGDTVEVYQVQEPHTPPWLKISARQCIQLSMLLSLSQDTDI